MSRASLALIAAAALTLCGCGQNARTTETEEAAAVQQANPPAPTRVSQAQPARMPAAKRAPVMLDVPEGMVMKVKLRTDLNSAMSRAGDPFTAVVVKDVMVDGQLAIPAGSQVRGTVKDVKPAKRGAGNASMTLAFDRLQPSGSSEVPILASLSQQTDSKKKRNAAVIGGSAAGGALLGRIIGKDTKGAVVGAVVGGAIGTGVVMSKEGEQVNLPSGTKLEIQLDRAIQVPQGS